MIFAKVTTYLTHNKIRMLDESKTLVHTLFFKNGVAVMEIFAKFTGLKQQQDIIKNKYGF